MPSLENLFASPPAKPRSPDRVDFVADQLGEQDAAKMRKLMDKKSQAPATEAPEDWGQDKDLELSAAEKTAMVKDKLFAEIMTREASALQKFFGREFQIPSTPAEATPERLAEWREQGFELHYLPSLSLIDITQDAASAVTDVKPKNIPGWKKKPEAWFFEQIKNGKLSKGAAELKGGWVLVDTKPKPSYDDGKQMYPDDSLALALAELNRQGIIKQASYDGKIQLAPESRFGISPRELADPRVMEALAAIFQFDPSNVSLQRAIEFNVLGNLHHPEWGETNTSEWFADEHVAGSKQLFGGDSADGGLSYVNSHVLVDRDDGIGFRLLGRFSSRKEKNAPVAGGGR